ncbi:hypothetical protein HU200_066680 [Digitaria exilis]|uniref:Uncharacterized protein n=1 Tax=Digitaria exilis TaxID=1010633 RepID=A0A834ZW39_9POAL|nr:hypothetical protein HU200_066680 [Digitaria exilis]
MSSCMAPIITPVSPGGEAAAALRESLLQRPPAATATTSSRREAIEQLRERVEGLRRELDAANDGAEAAEASTRHAERREREAAAELHATARTSKMQGEKLRELEDELRYKDGRIKVLEAIVRTMTTKKRRDARGSIGSNSNAPMSPDRQVLRRIKMQHTGVVAAQQQTDLNRFDVESSMKTLPAAGV